MQTVDKSLAKNPDKTLDKSVILVGHMGAGKTSLGHELAEALGVAFADSDALIEREANQSIADIFAESGERAFRAKEYAMLCRLLAEAPQVIASGGGMFIQPTCRALIADRAMSIWLRASVPCLASRLADSKNRPLLKDGDVSSKLTELARLRDPIYGLADLIIDNDGTDKKSVRNELLMAINRYQQAQKQHGESAKPSKPGTREGRDQTLSANPSC